MSIQADVKACLQVHVLTKNSHSLIKESKKKKKMHTYDWIDWTNHKNSQRWLDIVR